MKSRTLPLVVLWASLAVLVTSVVLLGIAHWQSTEQPESIGVRPTASLYPSASASALPSPSPTVPSASASPSPSPTIEQPVEVSAPARLKIPAIDVDTKIFPVGLMPDGAIEIPEDIRYVGWYDLGVPPGVDRGSAVLVAHRDGREQGRGVFYWLGNLKIDDVITVKTRDGGELPYKVVAREFIKKKRLPYEELFAVDGPHRLTLISCGGYYDRNNGGYQDNVVVTAVPMFEPIPVDPAEGSEPSPSPSATEEIAAAGPASVAVAAPQAATVEVEPSKPVLLGGGRW